MANRQRAEARRKAAAKAARGGGGGGGGSAPWLWIGVALAAVVAVVLVVVLVTGGGDDDPAAGDTTVATNPASNFPDSQPVEVDGDALFTYNPDAPLDEAVGVTAPILVGKNFQGDTITVDAAANGATMLVFLAHWCPHCNAEIPRLLDWKTLGDVPDELNVIGVATANSPNSVNYPPADWFSNKGWSWPVLVDESQGDGVAGVAASAMGASAWPYIVIIGADGKVKVRVSGEKSIDEINRLVTDALNS